MARSSKSNVKNFLLVATTLLAVSYFAVDYLPKNLSPYSGVKEEEIRKIAQEVVENYIKENPKTIIASLEGMQKQEYEKRNEEASSLVKNNLKELQDTFAVPIVGVKNAKHVIVHFYDYQCGYCQKAAEAIKEVIKKHSGEVLIIFRDMPILGENSLNIAKIAGAVAKYNPEKYSNFYFDVFKQANKSVESIKKLAIEYGADKTTLDSFLQSQVAQDYVNRNHEIARKIKLMGTPYIIIDDKVYQGNLSYESMKEFLK